MKMTAAFKTIKKEVLMAELDDTTFIIMLKKQNEKENCIENIGQYLNPCAKCRFRWAR